MDPIVGFGVITSLSMILATLICHRIRRSNTGIVVQGDQSGTFIRGKTLIVSGPGGDYKIKVFVVVYDRELNITKIRGKIRK